LSTTTIDRVDFLPEEWWNGHAHLARVIASMALQHRDIGNTHPADLTKAEWDDVLTRIGEPLLAYATEIDRFDGDPGERLTAARKGLELFASWFDKFCD
jgi:hypothetical protein